MGNKDIAMICNSPTGEEFEFEADIQYSLRTSDGDPYSEKVYCLVYYNFIWKIIIQKRWKFEKRVARRFADVICYQALIGPVRLSVLIQLDDLTR